MKTSPKASESVSDPLVGQTVGGKYAIVRLIGRGGVGLVYLARHLQRDVVVKVLAPHWATDAEALARFEREAKRLSGLHHPNIVEMLDFGRDTDRGYLVMEYLQGELLSDYVTRKRRLTLEEFVPIAAQILKGIGHAHSREVMVRDVKPANVMLVERKGRANFVKILDFGLAKLLRGEQAITEEHVMGTVGYLAPEAIRGESIDLRVDVYAIGVLFYYMLSGRLPFEGDSNAAVFYKTIHEQPRNLVEVVGAGAGLPDGLVELVHQCLEKDPEQRPADADRVVERLIDVVPASLFRLPRSQTASLATPTAVPPGVGNTGLIELVGARANTGELMAESETMTPIPGTLRPIHSPLPTGATAPAANDTTRATSPGLEPLPVPSRTIGLVALSVAAGVVLTVLVVAAVMLMMRRDDDGGALKPAAITPAATGEAGRDAIASALDDIDAKVGRNQLDAAGTALERVRELALDDDAKARVAASERRIVLARLAATAARFESEGDTAAALETYREILDADPDHAAARSAIARLFAAGTPSVAGDPPATAAFAIVSRPIANLAIDGHAAGTTPYDGKLAVGRHSVRITARGYAPWEGSIEVVAGDNLPLSVQLRGKGPGHAADPTPVVGEPTAKPEPTVKPEPTAKPEPTPEAELQPSGDVKKDPFLPTKKGGQGDDVFLPVKKVP
ncbi:MAG: protein kinase [Deltaproteobacteria bacterium]|nr:protein kinase [Deltaproteobacteria bacterium]MBK8718299.1 protein kinase [Deltaproteobacteria bacterium]MBP7291450.1 protein kinase [Nannocystaceae bacterium]